MNRQEIKQHCSDLDAKFPPVWRELIGLYNRATGKVNTMYDQGAESGLRDKFDRVIRDCTPAHDRAEAVGKQVMRGRATIEDYTSALVAWFNAVKSGFERVKS